MNRKIRFPITAKYALLIGGCPRVQHAPARLSTMTANFGHMITIPTHNFAALSAGEPRLA
jgi:hypothetical protein